MHQVPREPGQEQEAKQQLPFHSFLLSLMGPRGPQPAVRDFKVHRPVANDAFHAEKKFGFQIHSGYRKRCQQFAFPLTVPGSGSAHAAHVDDAVLCTSSQFTGQTAR